MNDAEQIITEKHLVTDFTRYRKGKKSLLVADEYVNDEGHFICPRCGERFRFPRTPDDALWNVVV